jgi:hypothetical protein
VENVPPRRRFGHKQRRRERTVAKRKITPERESECDQLRRELPAQVEEYTRLSAKAPATLGLTADAEGLAALEDLHWRVAKGETRAPCDDFECVAGFFFAQVLIERAGGRWDIHDVCSEKWRPYVILHVGDKKLGVFHIVGSGPRRRLTKLLRDLTGDAGARG